MAPKLQTNLTSFDHTLSELAKKRIDGLLLLETIPLFSSWALIEDAPQFLRMASFSSILSTKIDAAIDRMTPIAKAMKAVYAWTAVPTSISPSKEIDENIFRPPDSTKARNLANNIDTPLSIAVSTTSFGIASL